MGEKSSTIRLILIVDDEALIRWSLGARLASAGYRVQEAADGAAALAHFTDGGTPCDLALLDLRLPDTDGLQLLRAIRNRTPTCPVILMTAFGTVDQIREAQALGVYDILHKPFALDVMVRTVNQALARPVRT